MPPRLLVSVRDPDEAATAHRAGADLIDAKDPARGALGALPEAIVRDIVTRVGASTTTSAVAGEPESAAELIASVAAMAATGVDYVKVAVGAWQDVSVLSQAASEAPGRLIGVVFAEEGASSDIVTLLAEAGFRGAMIDTRGKDGRRLTHLLDTDHLSAFITACRSHGLLSGLAGSLGVAEVGTLAGLAPDYLGFRGGLCLGADRTRALDPERIRAAAGALRAIRRRDAA